MEISSNHFSPSQDDSDPVESYRATATILSRVRLYIIAQSLFLIPSLLIPLWYQTTQVFASQSITFLFIGFSGWALRKMYVQNQLFFRLESFRLVIAFLFSAYLFKNSIVFDSSMLFLSLGAFISLIWLFILKPEFED